MEPLLLLSVELEKKWLFPILGMHSGFLNCLLGVKYTFVISPYLTANTNIVMCDDAGTQKCILFCVKTSTTFGDVWYIFVLWISILPGSHLNLLGWDHNCLQLWARRRVERNVTNGSGGQEDIYKEEGEMQWTSCSRMYYCETQWHLHFVAAVEKVKWWKIDP